jgi:hypothetical protein
MKKVICPACAAEIHVSVSSLNPPRWATSELPNIAGICEKVKDGSIPLLQDNIFNCPILDRAVLDILFP